MENAPTAITSVGQTSGFHELGYSIVKQAVAPDMIAVLENYARLQRFNDYYLHDAETNSQWRYADALGESLLLHLQPTMEKITGCELYPTNSVLRIYRNGGILKKHVDRPTCEYSATLTKG